MVFMKWKNMKTPAFIHFQVFEWECAGMRKEKDYKNDFGLQVCSMMNDKTLLIKWTRVPV